MGESSEILIEIKGSAKEFVEALESIEHKAGSLENQLKFTAAVSGIAFAALSAEIGLSVAAYGKQEKATNQLVQALQNQGIYSKELVASYREQAEVIEEKTGIDAEQIVQGQALIQTLIGQTEVSEELTQAAVDLSVKTGSVSSAFELLGLGIEGRTKGLKNLGITIDEHLGKQERMAKIIELVSQKYGDQAEASTQGVAGIVKLEAAFEKIQKQIGEHFAPAITAAEQYVTGFLNSVSKNKPLLDMVAIVLAAGVAATGLVAVLSGLGVAFVAATALAGAFGFTLSVALGPIGLIAAAVAGLGAAVAAYALHANDAGSASEDLQKKIKETSDGIDRLQKIADSPIRSVFSEQAKKDVQDAKDALADYQERLRKLQSQASENASGSGQSDEKRKLAEKEAADKADREARSLAALQAHDDLVRVESENASKDLIEIKKQEADLLSKIADEKFKSERGALKERLAQFRELESDQRSEDIDKRKNFNQSILANDAEYAKLSESEKKEFLLRDQAILQASIDTERTARIRAAKDRADLQLAANNQFIKDQQKFGTALALIEKAMNDNITSERRKAASDLAQLQQSSNDELKAIGKAAAIANIVIQTADASINIWKGFSTIPIVGPALAVAAIAASVAFGAEQIGKVTAAADGGLITGGVPGLDSVHGLLMPGELVVPEKNFEEVVGSVAAQRNGEQFGAGQNLSGQSGYAHVEISLKDSLMDFIETKILERRSLNLAIGVA